MASEKEIRDAQARRTTQLAEAIAGASEPSPPKLFADRTDEYDFRKNTDGKLTLPPVISNPAAALPRSFLEGMRPIEGLPEFDRNDEREFPRPFRGELATIVNLVIRVGAHTEPVKKLVEALAPFGVRRKP